MYCGYVQGCCFPKDKHLGLKGYDVCNLLSKALANNNNIGKANVVTYL